VEDQENKETPVHFLADDKSSFVSALFDVTPVLGSPRAKRFVLIVDNVPIELDCGPRKQNIHMYGIMTIHL